MHLSMNLDGAPDRGEHAQPMSTPTKKQPRVKEKAQTPQDLDIVLICNPQAGGRWKALADILDSEEARDVRRIVTDSILDIGPALASLGSKTRLLCIYGGDGTIQRIIDQLFSKVQEDRIQLAFIGGGTMNVTARWCGLLGSPGENFRSIVKAYARGQLLLRDVPLLEVRQGSEVHYGFTFGMGPLVRILNAYENGTKGKAAALSIALKSIGAVWSNYPPDFVPVLREMEAEISVDDEVLPYTRYVGTFCNITGKVHIGVDPFPEPRSRETFYHMSYAITRRELTLLLPFLVRGRRPIDARSLLKPVSTWKQIAMSYLGEDSFPVDPRYVNVAASRYRIRTTEPIYTVDGEILQSNGEPITVSLGHTIRLAVSSTVGLSAPARLAAGVTGL